MKLTPIFEKTIRQYPYTIIYRSGKVKLDRIEGIEDYDKVVVASNKAFKGYKKESEGDRILKIKDKDNILYVNYSKSDAIQSSISKSEVKTQGAIMIDKDNLELDNYKLIPILKEKEGKTQDCINADKHQGNRIICKDKCIRTGDKLVSLYLIIIVILTSIIMFNLVKKLCRVEIENLSCSFIPLKVLEV